MGYTKITYVILVLFFILAFYVRAKTLIDNSYANAVGDGIKYTYFAASLNHDTAGYTGDSVKFYPPAFFYISAFVARIYSEFNAAYLVAALLSSLSTVGVFLFVKEFTKSTFLGLSSAFAIAISATDIVSFVKMYWIFAVGASLLPLFLVLIYRFIQKGYRYAILAGALAGLHFLFYPAITIVGIFAVLILYFILFRPKEFKKLALIISIGLLISLLYLPAFIQGFILPLLSNSFTLQTAIGGGVVLVFNFIWKYSSSWVYPIIFILVFLNFVKYSKQERKIYFHFEWNQKIGFFWVYFLVTVLAMLSFNFNVNSYWSLRYNFIFPQFAIISFPILLKGAFQHPKWHLLFIGFILTTFIVSYSLFDTIVNEKWLIILNSEKVEALEWLSTNTPKDAKILFMNNDWQNGGFDAWRFFSWRENSEFNPEQINLFLNSQTYPNNFTHAVIIKRSAETKTDFGPLGEALDKKTSQYGFQKVFENKLIVIKKNTLFT